MLDSDSLIHDWLNYIQQVHKRDETIIKNGTKFFFPFKAISMPIVRKVFHIISEFKLNFRTKYLALSIYDKFMCSQFWEIFSKYGNNPDSNEYKNANDEILKFHRLRLMSSIQLASKMDCLLSGLGTSQVIHGLQLIDVDEKKDYTPDDILNSEYTVFKFIDFKIPLITPADSIEILLSALSLDEVPRLFNTTMKVLDFTYLQHEQLYYQLQFSMTGTVAKTKVDKLSMMVMECDILFLSSGIILCALLIFKVKDSVLKIVKEQLSKLVKIQESDIWGISQAIFSMLDLH